jgi:hypothetical protein
MASSSAPDVITQPGYRSIRLGSKSSLGVPSSFTRRGRCRPQSRRATPIEISRKFALPTVAAQLRRGFSVFAVSTLVASIPLAVAQQYPPPAYPNPSQPPGYPGAAEPPVYPGQGYGGPGAPPLSQQEAVPPPPGAAMVWRPGYWSWSRHGWVWVSGRYVSRPYPRANWVPGHWTQRHGGWVWVPGHWR